MRQFLMAPLTENGGKRDSDFRLNAHTHAGHAFPDAAFCTSVQKGNTTLDYGDNLWKQ